MVIEETKRQTEPCMVDSSVRIEKDVRVIEFQQQADKKYSS